MMKKRSGRLSHWVLLLALCALQPARGDLVLRSPNNNPTADVAGEPPKTPSQGSLIESGASVVDISQRYLQSQSAEQLARLENQLRELLKNARAKPPSAMPRNVYLLAIGIDKYSYLDESLRFSRKDAEEFAQAVRESAKTYESGIIGDRIHLQGFYDGRATAVTLPVSFLKNNLKITPPEVQSDFAVHIATLLDAQATRDGIEAAFRNIAAVARPDDLFIFFYSGLAGNDEKEIYLAPSDVQTKENDRDVELVSMIKNAIPGSLLREWSGQIQAANQLFLIDTSGSEEALAQFGAKATTDPIQLKKLAARNLMVAGIAGPAIESADLRHGVLTYALLQAMKGEADFGSPVEGLVTARELQNYLPWKVAQLRGAGQIEEQHIINFSQGKDFWLFPVPPKEKVPTNDVPAIDKTPPSLAITVPELQRGFKLVTDVAVLEVSGQALDASGVREVQVNGKVAELTEAGNFRFVLDVPLGESEVLVRATDVADNTATTTFTVKREASGALVQAVADRRGTDYALFFATADYDYWPKLNNPIRDAEALAGVLQDRYGFHTEIVRNPKLRDFTAKLAEYKAKVYQRDDQLFIFFAGHGTLSPEKGSTEGYLVAKNSVKVEDGSDYPFNYLPLSLLANSINTILCPHILVAVDACYGGIFGGDLIRQAVDHDLPRDTLPRVGQNFNGVRLASAAAPSRLAQLLAAAPEAPRLNRAQYIQRMLRPVSRLFLTSGQIRAVADGPPGGHSPFAQQLLNTLRTRTDEYRVLDFDELKTDVAKLQQEPHYGSWGNHETNGSFLFIAR